MKDFSVFLSDELLKSLSAVLNCPDLQVFIDANWGSQQHNHRELLRQQISLINPQGILQSSISHTEGMGVVAFSKNPLGVDIEVTSRVLSRVIARVSSPEELTLAPSPSALWCAKEAAFKALREFQQPSVLSQISIGEWQKIDSQTETFRLKNYALHNAPHSGCGVILYIKSYTLGLFIFSS